MSDFKVNIEALTASADELETMSGHMSKASGDVLDVQNTLVMDGSYKTQIIRSMNELETAVLKEAVKAKNLAQALIYICDRYRKTEQMLCGELSVIEKVVHILDTGAYEVLDHLGLGDAYMRLRYDYDEFDEARTQEKMMDLYLQYQCLALMEDPKYDETAWNKATPDEREQMIRDFIVDVNAVLGTTVAIDVIFDDGKGNTENNGYFSWKGDGTAVIYINPERLKTGDRKVFNTCIHESRHCYQHCAVENPERYIVSEETLKQWDKNFKHYIDPDDDKEGYYTQPVEWDTFNFADQTDRIAGKTPVYSGSWD